MKITLPIQTKEYTDSGIKITASEKEFDLDTSLASEIRWEAKFPEQAEKADLFSYTQRIQENKSLTAPVLLSKMKSIYCWFDTDVSFIDFVKMFDLSDKNYTDKLTAKITKVWETIQEGSAEKN